MDLQLPFCADSGAPILKNKFFVHCLCQAALITEESCHESESSEQLVRSHAKRPQRSINMVWRRRLGQHVDKCSKRLEKHFLAEALEKVLI